MKKFISKVLLFIFKKAKTVLPIVFYTHQSKTFNNQLTMSEKEELNKLRQKYILKFDEFVKKGDNPWKTPEQLSGSTETSITQVNSVIMNFDDFVKNSKGEFLTRKQYENLTPTLKKLYHQLINKIK